MADSVDFREALARFASGVTVITTMHRGESYGFTASAFSSLSLDPPLVLVCLQKDADCFPAFEAADRFAISILSKGQTSVALRFATKGVDKFAEADFEMTTSGPVVRGATATLECGVYAMHEGGDHVILVGRVISAGAGDAEPLLHVNRRFGRFIEESQPTT